MTVLLEFDVPLRTEFADIREFIIEWLESGGGSRHPDDLLFHSLGNVRVSKPITPWRDPAKQKNKPVKLVQLNQETRK